jgi:hypothetical protein
MKYIVALSTLLLGCEVAVVPDDLPLSPKSMNTCQYAARGSSTTVHCPYGDFCVLCTDGECFSFDPRICRELMKP